MSVYKKSVLNNCKLGHTRIFAEKNVTLNDSEFSGTIFFGFGTYMNSSSIRGLVEIGRYCSIGRNVKIGLGSHNLSGISTSPFLEHLCRAEDAPNILVQESPKRNIIIGNDVWIGDNTLIKKGITIGNGAIIGAGSIITKNVPDYAVVAGIPARVIRFRFEEYIIDKLLSIKWWEKSPEVLHALPPKLTIGDYIEKIELIDSEMKQSYDVIFPVS